MVEKTFRSVLAMALSGVLALWGAVAPPIGVAKAVGEFRIAGSPVRGNGTVFEGDIVESTNGRADLVLNAGTQVSLAPGSRGKIFQNRAILEKGTGEFRTAAAYSLEAGSLRVSLTGGSAQVALSPEDGHPGKDQVRVAALDGEVTVKNAQGLLVARLMPGRTLLFAAAQGGASTNVQLQGKVTKIDGKYFLTDDTTGVTVQLEGTGLDKYVGKVVEITGSSVPGAAPAAGATQVIAVTGVSLAVKGLSAGAWTAIIGGIGAGSAVGALFATGVLGGSQAPVSRP